VRALPQPAKAYAGTRLKVVDKFAGRRDELTLEHGADAEGRGAARRDGQRHPRHHLNGGLITYIATDDEAPEHSARDAHRRVWRATECLDRDKATDAELQRGEHRVMDCLDCHNRAGHAFAPPERALDRALAAGQISHGCPFVKREALRLVKAEYADHDRAGQAIDSS
jgi:hypothetical protein